MIVNFDPYTHIIFPDYHPTKHWIHEHDNMYAYTRLRDAPVFLRPRVVSYFPRWCSLCKNLLPYLLLDGQRATDLNEEVCCAENYVKKYKNGVLSVLSGLLA